MTSATPEPTPTVPPEYDLLRVREVAQLLRVSEWTVRSWANQGLLPHRKVGGIIRFRRSDVDAFAGVDNA